MGDLRVPLDPALTAFGVPATVTRPAPDNWPVATTAIWLPPLLEEPRPVGTDFQRREPRRLLSLPRAAPGIPGSVGGDRVLSTMPRGTTIVAAERLGEAAKTWRVDGLERTEADEWRVIVVID